MTGPNPEEAALMRLRYFAIHIANQNREGESQPVDAALQMKDELPSPIWLPRPLDIKDVRTIRNHTVKKIDRLDHTERESQRMDDLQFLKDWFKKESIVGAKRGAICEKLGVRSGPSQSPVSILIAASFVHHSCS